ncbi:CoA transferase subunit A [Mycolicibacterium sp.]|uniref:CoA transferase subunit A n=1 Tax=Mycolicibacterium sp. TaxID=2320850 RepID=UPI00355EA2D1
MTLNKVVGSAAEAVADIPHGASLAVGGFGLAGIPWFLIEALLEQGAGDLTIVSNNCGVDGAGLGLLLDARRISRVIASYVGENKEFARQYLAGELTVELTPQGTLAERLRAGGSGIGAFYTPTGVGTLVAEGGMPWRYAADGSIALASPPKEVRTFNGREMLLEEGIVTDFALVRAAVADKAGNCVFHAAARNFNPPAAMSGRVAIVEAERVVEVGELHPDEIHLSGIFVQRVHELTPEQANRKSIEKLTTRVRQEAYQ